MKIPLLLLLALAASAVAADPPEPKFRAVTIDDKIQIGYGVAVADVDGDGRPDVLLADKKQIVWYQNPGEPPPGAATFAPSIWSKFVIAENLTKNDNVCLAAQDLDGDGKCELAVGAEWNPGDTVNSGAVFYLIPPEDRQQKWEPVRLHAEPTTHRMKWLQFDRKDRQWGLVVVPLHGRGNKNGQGDPVKILLYHPPSPLNDAKGEWKTDLADESMHMTHNFRLLKRGFFLVGKEGAPYVFREDEKWQKLFMMGLEQMPAAGAGEIAFEELSLNTMVCATVEPMHGNQLVVYVSPPKSESTRRVLTDKLVEGHALACGRLSRDVEIVVGWRGMSADRKPGVALWTPLDDQGSAWRETRIDDGGMACEDLVLADLNADGKLDIVASGRATKNVKIYFNETAR